jgi:hypothetical protein
METKKILHDHAEVLARRGLRLPKVALGRLWNAGIYCSPDVSMEHQKSANRFVVRGVESGGAIRDLGLYCGFVDGAGRRIPWLQRVNCIVANGIHAVVVAPELTRIEIFRTGDTCELLITQHRLEHVSGRAVPLVRNTVLFHGKNGMLRPGSPLPGFLKRSGEPLPLPKGYEQGIVSTVSAVSCSGCKHVHVLLNPEAAAVPSFSPED